MRSRGRECRLLAVRCALGWACWKTYLGRPETDQIRYVAITQLGNGLHYAERHEDALSVYEAALAMLRHVGATEEDMLVAQCNLANTYAELGRPEEALSMRREVYSGRLKLNGEEHFASLREADNYAVSLNSLERFEETRALLRKTIPVARRVLGGGNDTTIRMSRTYAMALYLNSDATLDDLRKALNILEDAARIARRVFGGVHPLTSEVEKHLREARAALRAREASA